MSTERLDRTDGAVDVLPPLLDLALTSVGQHILLRSTIIVGGGVTLNDAAIGQDLLVDHSQQRETDDAPGRLSFSATGATVGKRLIWSARLPPDSVVDLSRAKVDICAPNTPNYWPHGGRVFLSGLQYRTIELPILYRRQQLAGPSRRLRSRPLTVPVKYALRFTDRIAGEDGSGLTWIRLHTRRAFDAQPYDALAAAHSSAGRDREATSVMVARSDDRRRARGPAAFTIGLPYRLIVGNGFRTWLAAVWIAVTAVVGAYIYTDARHRNEIITARPVAETVKFEPLVYSLDVLLPIVDLGEARDFAPLGRSSNLVRWFWFAEIGLGWVLTTALAASATSTLQRRISR